MPNYVSYRHHHHWLDAYNLTKASWEISAWSLEDFSSKGWKMIENTYIMHSYAN